jgi:hypothetical protein
MSGFRQRDFARVIVAPADSAYESVMAVANKVQEKEGSGEMKKRTLRMSGWGLRSGETEKKALRVLDIGGMGEATATGSCRSRW